MKIELVREPDRVVSYWKAQKPVVAAIVFFGLGFNVLMALAPVWQGKLIDALVGGRPFADIVRQAATFVALVAFIQALRYYKRYYIRRFANATNASMRMMIYESIMSRPTADLERETAGDLMTRAQSDVELCVEGMRKFTTELFDTGVLLASYAVSLFLYDVPITALALLSVPLAMLLAQKLKGLIYGYTVAWRKKNSEIAELTWGAIENAMLYRVRGMERANAARYAAELDDLRKKAVRANLLENSMQPIYNAIAMLGAVAVIWLGGNRVIAGAWTVGQFSAYLSIFAAIAVKASKASKLFNSVQKSRVSWQRIKPFLAETARAQAGEAEAVAPQAGNADEGDAQTDEPKADETARPESGSSEATANGDARVRGQPARLVVQNLSFGYGGAPVISGLSFRAEAGGILGITGPVASGKSSLALALTGLYPYGGSVAVDGRELASLQAEERSRLISWQGHRAELFTDTIRANVSLGADDEIEGTLATVRLTDDLKTMSLGTETPVGAGGVRLSGGQQARVALARALQGKRKIIILDDPFSAVDVNTEREIIANLRADYRDSLIILVSHRLTAFPEADGIVFLRDGHTAEYGTHAELMRRSSLYRSIYELQCATCGGEYEE